MSSDGTSTCEGCGASVYKEHLDAGIARYEDGRLLCKHCVEEYKKSDNDVASSADADFEPIQFDDEDTFDKPHLRPRISFPVRSARAGWERWSTAR